MAQPMEAVFDAPTPLVTHHEHPRPVDLVHLARQTGGDRALEEEVLQMFLRQAQNLKRDLANGGTPEARRRLAHALNGTARAVGAFQVASIAHEIENNPGDYGRDDDLSAEVDQTCSYINALLR